MRVCKELKLNKFRQVSIPSNKDLFYRVGRRAVPDMVDGQVASFASDTMNMLSDIEDNYLKGDKMPLDTDIR